MKKLTTVFAILVMAIAALADAGVGQMPQGGSAGIMGDDLGIRLAEETVVVELEKDGYDVSFSVLADFTLRNNGSEKSVFLFLPVTTTGWHRSSLDELMDGSNPGVELKGYDVWLELDGAKLDHQLFIVKSIYDEDDLVAPEGRIAFQTNDGEKYALWPISRATDEDLNAPSGGWWEIWAVCSVDIPAGDSTLRYHYEGVPSRDSNSDYSYNDYPLWSGSSWSGTIGAGTVAFVIGDGLTIDDTFGYSAPEGVEVESMSNGYRFSFENYEPQPGDEVSVELITNTLDFRSRERLRVAPSSGAAFISGVESVEDYHRLYLIDSQGDWFKFRTKYKNKEVTGWVCRKIWI